MDNFAKSQEIEVLETKEDCFLHSITDRQYLKKFNESSKIKMRVGELIGKENLPILLKVMDCSKKFVEKN